jgi:HEAT repeat protein
MVTPRADATQQPVAESPRRKRFRLQYGIRSLLLLATILALLLSAEAKRAYDQAQLVREVGDLAGTCRRKPRRWAPDSLRRLFGDNHGSTVEQVHVGAMAARSPVGFTSSGGPLKVIDSAKLRELLSLPAMTQVRFLNLHGTAVSDELIDDLAALPKLEGLWFEMTAVTEAGVERLKQALPECNVFYNRAGNGPSMVTLFHRDQVRLTDDLSIFRRAENGELAAVEALLRLAGEHDRDAATAAVESLSTIQDPEALALLIDGLSSDNPRVRRAVVQTLGSHRDLGRLAKALNDPDLAVRLEAVYGLATFRESQALGPLRHALEDRSPEVRRASVCALTPIKDPAVVDVLIAAVKDTDVDVRWDAIHGLESFRDPRAVEALIGALKDEKSIVRSAAAAALGEIPDSRAVEPLKTAAKDEDSFVRNHASAALAKLRETLGNRR